MEFLEAFPTQRINIEIKEKGEDAPSALNEALDAFDEAHPSLRPLHTRLVVNSRYGKLSLGSSPHMPLGLHRACHVMVD